MQPLAERLRHKTLDQFVGKEHLYQTAIKVHP